MRHPVKRERTLREPSEMLREAVLHLRRAAIAEPKILPIAEKIERIAEVQAEYEAARKKERK